MKTPRTFSFCCFLLFSVFHGLDALRFPGFFVPEEVQTLLSLVYSRLPPTKIGSDKRFGIGFRLGRNADAQILIELGPQSETEPLSDATSGFSKRETGKRKYQQTAVKNNTSRHVKKAAGANKTGNAARKSKSVEEDNTITTEKEHKPNVPSRIKVTNNPKKDKLEQAVELTSTTPKSSKKGTKRPQTFLERMVKLLQSYTQERQGTNKNSTSTTTKLTN